MPDVRFASNLELPALADNRSARLSVTSGASNRSLRLDALKQREESAKKTKIDKALLKLDELKQFRRIQLEAKLQLSEMA